MKAVITKLFITEAQIPYISYIAHIFQKSMYKHHCMKCATCEHIATLPRGTQRIVNIIIPLFGLIWASTSTSTQPRFRILEADIPGLEWTWAVDVESQVRARQRYTLDNDVYNALRASRQCCNVLTCVTLHAVVFIHRFLKYMGDIWNIWDLGLSDAGLTITAFIYSKYITCITFNPAAGRIEKVIYIGCI